MFYSFVENNSFDMPCSIPLWRTILLLCHVLFLCGVNCIYQVVDCVHCFQRILGLMTQWGRCQYKLTCSPTLGQENTRLLLKVQGSFTVSIHARICNIYSLCIFCLQLLIENIPARIIFLQWPWFFVLANIPYIYFWSDKKKPPHSSHVWAAVGSKMRPIPNS